MKDQAEALNEEYIIRGYILATPKRDHKWLIKKLKEKQIDLSKYRHLLE
ncbi:DUF2621 family protein [Thermoactinomyces sp. Gus2-1]